MAQDADPFRVDPETMARLKARASDPVEQSVQICQALSDERRLQILRLLDTTDLCVFDLVEVFDIEYSKLSYHLKQLREAGLVETNREGNFVTYELTATGLATVDGLNQFVEHEAGPE